jgi:hypothetical protein
VEYFFSSLLGIPYSEFLDTGKSKLPEDVFRELVSDIKAISLGCMILVVDFSDDEPSIYRIHESGTVEMCSNFAAVGTGIYIAESMLFLREHRSDVDISDGLFNVYEALWLGRRAPGVGDEFSVRLLSRAGDEFLIEYVSEEGENYFSKQLDKFSLRPLKGIEYKKTFMDKASSLSKLSAKVKNKAAKAK